MNKLIKRKDTFYILEDMNIDISVKNRSPAFSKYVEYLISNGAIPIITLPTRVTNISSTTIDHIITNDTLHKIKPGIIRCDSNLFDHYCTLCNITGNFVSQKRKADIFIRDKSNFDPETNLKEMSYIINNFVANLEELTVKNYDYHFDAFVSLIQNVINCHVPLKKLSRKEQKLKKKPWIIKSIYADIRLKNKM